MIKFEVISLKKQYELPQKQYELPRYNDYYSIENNTVQNGYINVSKELSKSTFFKKIGTVKDFRISLDIQMCSKLGISLKNKKFYLMNLFVGHGDDIKQKHKYSRQLLFFHMREQTNIDYCIINVDKPRYELYDKIIVYIIGGFYKYKILVWDYISNTNILILEDGKDILLLDNKNTILNIINIYNINHVLTLHCTTKILDVFNKITKLISITYYPYPISIKHEDEKLTKYDKKYDIFLFGTFNIDIYPFRNRLKLLLNKYENTILKYFKIKILDNTNKIFGEELMKLIKQSKFVICTGSKYNVLLRKYIEVNYSNAYIIGNNPYNIIPSDSIIIIEPYMSDNTILSILVDAIKNYDYLKDNVTPIMGGALTYENLYKDIMDMSFIKKYNNYIINSINK